ncbi:hypothetical protein Y032_0010g950 [Ancylostoma ceylanicum]|uniref:Acetylcholine receptor-like protein cup-4 n=1 Tax=Ancylostoma ceylanicum TaxID=53326 RepID=A0A016VHI1_9BILA|nr:hypothetical protein Y032_0010g950 [Ancylostoma ceylanicum]
MVPKPCRRPWLRLQAPKEWGRENGFSVLSLGLCYGQNIDYNKKLEDVLLKNYNSRHRPVKKESTTVQVNVYMGISHVEKVDEHEQTMLVHGHLWATWFDEYLVWNPKEYNDTSKINIDSWRIWQPALALYNSARGNSWHLYMHGLPAMIGSSGRVWASGSFSFHVTCRFDFSAWPYDEQECPIVIADWVYDLSRVNLSDPQGDNPWNKPSIRLNYDPVRQDEKKHVAGWEVMDTWRRHCYWGPSGCKEELPDGQPEWYWSLLEFGVKLKRHAPYFGLTIIMPTIITCLLTLCSFWIDTPSMAIALVIFNVLLQGLFGWDLIRELPPGSGSIPKIVSLYGFNLSMTTIAFMVNVLAQFFESVLPSDLELPEAVLTLPEKLRMGQLFQVKGLSFDPQLLLNYNVEEEDPKEFNSPLCSIEPTNALDEEDHKEEEKREADGETLIPMESASPSTVISLSPVPPVVQSSPVPAEDEVIITKTAQSLYIVRRIFFFIFFVMYLIAVPVCLI